MRKFTLEEPRFGMHSATSEIYYLPVFVHLVNDEVVINRDHTRQCDEPWVTHPSARMGRLNRCETTA